MQSIINYDQDYVILENNEHVIINIPFKNNIHSINNIKFKDKSIFLLCKNKEQKNILGQIDINLKTILYLKNKKKFLVNILNENGDLILSKFEILF